MILETIKTNGSHVFHGVKVFMVCQDGTLSIRDCDNDLLGIEDFSIYVRLRLLSDDGKVLHTVRDDAAQFTPGAEKPVSEGVKHVFDGENVVQILKGKDTEHFKGPADSEDW